MADVFQRVEPEGNLLLLAAKQRLEGLRVVGRFEIL